MYSPLGLRERRERGDPLILVWSLVFCVLKLFGSFPHRREISCSISVSATELLLPTSHCRSLAPSPSLLFPSSHTFLDGSTPCLIALEERSPVQKPKGPRIKSLPRLLTSVPGGRCSSYLCPWDMFGRECPVLACHTAYVLLLSMGWAYSLSTASEVSFSWIYSKLFFFNLSSFSPFWDEASFFSFYNIGSHWKRNLSLLKVEDSLLIYFLHLPYCSLWSKGQGWEPVQECCTRAFQGSDRGEWVLVPSREGTMSMFLDDDGDTHAHYQDRLWHLFACRASRVASTPLCGVAEEPFWAKSRLGIDNGLSWLFCS